MPSVMREKKAGPDPIAKLVRRPTMLGSLCCNWGRGDEEMGSGGPGGGGMYICVCIFVCMCVCVCVV